MKAIKLRSTLQDIRFLLWVILGVMLLALALLNHSSLRRQIGDELGMCAFIAAVLILISCTVRVIGRFVVHLMEIGGEAESKAGSSRSSDDRSGES